MTPEERLRRRVDFSGWFRADKSRAYAAVDATEETDTLDALEAEFGPTLMRLSGHELGVSDVECERPSPCEGYAMTLEEIAYVLGVSRERVRHIEATALAKLRNPLRWLPTWLKRSRASVATNRRVHLNWTTDFAPAGKRAR